MDRLVSAGHDHSSMHYVGTRRGIETRLLPPTGYATTLLDVIGLQRSLGWNTVLFLPKLVWATWKAWRLIGSLRPSVVVNVGGYASMPATFAARLRRTPVVVVSYDRRPGLASRLAARFATAVASAFEQSPLPNARLTGAPLRPEIIAVDRVRDRESARDTLGLPSDRFVVAVFGGSLGAKVINEAIAALVLNWADRRDVAIRHVVGERWIDHVPSGQHAAAGIMYDVIGYEDRMPLLFAACDLMVTRAGASTIAELAATGTPAIVIPWPDAAENHQLDNAKVLSDVGAAVLVEQSELDADRLATLIDDFIVHPEHLSAVAARALEAGRAHRGDSLITLIEQVAA